VVEIINGEDVAGGSPKIKVASLLKKVNPQQSDGLIPTLAFLLGQWHLDCGSKASRQLSSQASHCSCS
jgi:hypothetical protein